MSARKVLVVDDDAGMRDVLETALAAEGVEVYTSMDGKDAVQKTLAFKPGLILLDVNMPNLNGLTFCKAIRAGSETRNIPVIIISGLTAAGRVEQCLAAGADDFLGKPFRVEDLLMRMRAVFETAPIADHGERMRQYLLRIRGSAEQSPEATSS
jgi:DNA-binding response OmpR family regulator